MVVPLYKHFKLNVVKALHKALGARRSFETGGELGVRHLQNQCFGCRAAGKPETNCYCNNHACQHVLYKCLNPVFQSGFFLCVCVCVCVCVAVDFHVTRDF